MIFWTMHDNVVRDNMHGLLQDLLCSNRYCIPGHTSVDPGVTTSLIQEKDARTVVPEHLGFGEAQQPHHVRGTYVREPEVVRRFGSREVPSCLP